MDLSSCFFSMDISPCFRPLKCAIVCNNKGSDSIQAKIHV
ncbi:unnamed protein product [Arabidopsis lyrata]|nr:unnamed protein product [Arabidopsis lyrata]